MIRKTSIALFLLVSTALILSCDDSINPKTEFRERYILYAVLRGDTSFQLAILSHSYDVYGLDPIINTEDPLVKDADIKIWTDTNVVKFKDSTISRTDTSRYKGLLSIYYLNNFKPGFGTKLTIKARLANGMLLQSETRVPEQIILDSLFKIPIEDLNYFKMSWQPVTDGNTFYMCRYKLYYKKNNGAYSYSQQQIEIPLFLNIVGDTVEPVYPAISKNNFIKFDLETLNWVMKKISDGDPQKSNFYIDRTVLEIYSMDKELSNYFTTTHGYLDQFSVRLDETDYSNIDGGLGIFGAYNKQTFSFFLKEDYIRSFSYNYE
ncbi:MAG: DUF4249 family protein [Ignavibacteriales bacterium]|nr:DUF4249 family protein [Ignavibacteriales bacterium]